jgi:cation diffusion facilitator family transporter
MVEDDPPNQSTSRRERRTRAVGVVRTVTLWGMAANLGLSAVKFMGGWLATSQALVADAVHSLSDTATDLAVVVGVHYWSAPADADHPYGHGRIELLVSVVIGLLLAATGIGLGYQAIAELGVGRPTSRGGVVLAVALASMVMKEGLYQWTARVGRRLGSSAMVANAWHHRSDALSSLPVGVAGVGAILWPALPYLDHVATIVVTIFILQAAFGIVWPAVKKLADTGAERGDCQMILDLARRVDGVQSVHGLRTRYIGSGLQVDLHVLVDPELTVREGHDIAHCVEAMLLADGPSVSSVLLHVEPFNAQQPDATEPAPGVGPVDRSSQP